MNHDWIEHHVRAIVQFVRDGETDAATVIKRIKSEIARAEREAEMQTERLKTFKKDINMDEESSTSYAKSDYYYDYDRNRNPFKMTSETSEYLNFNKGDVIKFPKKSDKLNDDWDNWTT